jgi:hypothetical protein
MEKKFDAVKMVREIRDRMHEQTKKMTRAELLEFYRSKSAHIHSRLGRRSKVSIG